MITLLDLWINLIFNFYSRTATTDAKKSADSPKPARTLPNYLHWEKLLQLPLLLLLLNLLPLELPRAVPATTRLAAKPAMSTTSTVKNTTTSTTTSRPAATAATKSAGTYCRLAFLLLVYILPLDFHMSSNSFEMCSSYYFLVLLHQLLYLGIILWSRWGSSRFWLLYYIYAFTSSSGSREALLLTSETNKARY
jgi:hypothetical protein